MHYEEHYPVTPLSEHVKCLWILESDSSFPTSPERILPDGCTEFVFHLGDAFEQHHQDGTTGRQPMAMMVGQMRTHLLIQPTGKVAMLGVRFWPGGAYSFLRIPQHEIAGRVVELDGLGSFARDLHSRIADAPSAEEKFRAVENVLLKRLNQFDQPDERLSKAIKLIVQAGGCLSMDTLAGTIGLNSRGLDRAFNTRVGIPPKTLCRIVRFQQVFKKLERQHAGPNWPQIALECGYYDQSHFIKDFKAFAGKEPTAYLAEQNRMSEHFIASR
ncbi:MAG: helix-turn-helix domain-containing protein [Acidobacteriota bacterium]